MQLQDKLAQLKAKYPLPEDRPQLEAWEHRVQQLLLLESLQETQVILELRDRLRSEIDLFNVALLTKGSDKMNDRERDRLIDKRDLYDRVLSWFEVEGKREQLEKELNAN